ncbi:MAG: DUF1990 domain-containing protein [Nitrospira sp.]|nr:DUF1990 domain-containing protein [Nitrospira sp.]
MFLLKKPSEERIQQVLASQRDCPFSYPEVGASREEAPPAGYMVDHNRIKLGEGQETFTRAVKAVQHWEMFQVGWIQPCWPDAPIQVGTTVGVLAYHFAFWSLNMCRIVYLIEEESPIQKFGFAYGTLPEHGACGEERFIVEWHHTDNSVWYDLFAFSRPNHFLFMAGKPVARMFQKRFARDSKQAMFRAINKQHV